MVEVNEWWEKGFRTGRRSYRLGLVAALKSRKNKAWEDYQANDDSANGYRLGFYQGVLHIYESLQTTEHEAHHETMSEQSG